MMEESLFQQRLNLFFDSEFYLSLYDDVASAQADPLQHYIKLGWNEGRRPNRWFKDSMVPAELQAKKPDVPGFALFLMHLPGMTEEQFEEKCQVNTYVDIGHENCWDCDQMRDYFDGSYYRAKYSDIDKSADGLVHYCESGWRENRWPSIGFDPNYYLEAYPDVKAAAINPFVHYLNRGRLEGRKPSPINAVARKLLRNLKSFDEINLSFKKIKPVINLVSKGSLFSALLGQCDAKQGICVSISHDNYLEHTGGVQKFIRDESAAAQESGYFYLHLSPAMPSASLLKNGLNTTFLINCNINDKYFGTFTAAELAEVLLSLFDKQADIKQLAVVHSLMGWHMSAAFALFDSGKFKKFFYAHDYFALCPEYRLLRNHLHSCDGPALGAPSCNVCVHGSARAAHVDEFVRFFAKAKPVVLFPSPCAKRIFDDNKLSLKYKGIVVPHIQVQVDSTQPVPEPRDRDAIKVAFCGEPVPHKGFFHFEQILEHCRSVDQLQFFHLGKNDGKIPGVEFIPAALKNGKSMMTRRLQENEIDLVFVGSIWRETFNFVAYESVRAGAAIITLESSGNVADFVRQHGVGAVVSDWEAAAKLLQDENLPLWLNQWQAAAARLSFEDNRSIFTKGVM